MRKSLLVLVDVQNTFRGASDYFEGRGSIDYIKLKEDIIGWWQETTEEGNLELDLYAYVVQTPRYSGLDFFAFLKRAGYSLRVRHCSPKDEASDSREGSVGAMMQLDLVEMGSSYSDVLVVSGSGVFVPAFRALKNMWPSIQCHIAAFPTTLHKAYMEERDRDIVDTVINLDERVIYRNGSKKDNSKKSSEE